MIRAKLIFLGKDRGGRYTPPQSGFRPQLDLGGIHTSCKIEGLHGEEVFDFNEEYEVSLTLLYPAEYGDRIHVNDKVNLYEGNKLIGNGRILEVTP